MYVEVIVALPINKTFYYYSSIDVYVGEYVEVSFAQDICIALIISITSTCTIENIKEINRKLSILVASSHFIKFIKWVSYYNIISIGTILKLSLNVIDAEESYYTVVSEKKKYHKITSIIGRYNILNSLEICDLAKIRRTTLQKMEQQKIIRKVNKIDVHNHEISFDITLSGEQEQALFEIENCFYKYKTILLEGITGSGKTEVYLSAIAKLLQADKNAQALIMLPEIILTEQTIQRIQKYFKSVNIVTWHSNLSKKQKKMNWWRIIDGRAQIIIGARSALFLQYKKLKIIIVDEEHDSSFKQSTGKVSYNARDMAIVKAKEEGIPIVLSSATPSLESFHNAYQGKFIHIKLFSRYGQTRLPEFTIIDMKKNKNGKWISQELYNTIIKNIQCNQQVLLFLNRRGYTPLTICSQCGYRLQCINCSSWLVKHQIYQSFICHYCSYKVKSFNRCSQCNHEGTFVFCGPGIERIEEEVKLEIPSARVAIISSDTKNNRNIIGDILSKKIDIIIGTQVMAKGHHFPNLNLVGVIDADASLYSGDLRSAERTHQILQQVSGRAGRESKHSEVILQSYNPASIKSLCCDRGFYRHELESRKKNNMPPFTRITAITISHSKQDKAMSVSHEIAKALLHDNIKILGPTPAITYLIKKKYIYKVIIIMPRNFNIQLHLQKVSKYYHHIQIDIDSTDFL